MGNTNSTTTNPMWKNYQIQRIEKGSDVIRFFLDGNVKYSDGYFNYVDCFNAYPYYDIHAGDYIEVNWYKSEDYDSSHIFTTRDNLEVLRFIQELREYTLVGSGYGHNNGKLFYDIKKRIVLERKTEQKGDLIVEYIKEVEVNMYNEIVSSVEIWRCTGAY